MKRIISALLLILIITASCASLISCGNTPYSEGEGELQIVATCFPAFDFAREIAGDKATVKLLQHNGEDMHDFFPTTSTLSALKEADIFICVGGSSDAKWLDDALDSCNNPELTVIKLIDYVNSATAALDGHNGSDYCAEKHSALTFGASSDTAQTDDGEDHEHHSSSADEHVWTSPKAVVKMADAIAAACIARDGANEAFYSNRLGAFKAELAQLDTELTEAVAESAHKTLVFADRFPFIYLTQDYGICYYSAYAGCSAEAFAGFETVARLVETTKRLALPAIVTLETPNAELAQTIAELTKDEQLKIIQLNSMQTVTKDQIINDGVTYLSVMRRNIVELKEALK